MLTDILYESVDQLSDARLAGIVGTDGIGVEMIIDVENVPHDLITTELELAWLISAHARTAERFEAGMVRDIEMRTETLTYLLSLVIPGYYAVIGIDTEGNIERARFILWNMVQRCQVEV